MDALMFVRRFNMKVRLFKWLLTVTAFLCMALVATSVSAKKPTDTGPKNDSCTGLETPDVAFWRDSRTSGKNRMAQVSIYVAQSDNGCEAKLIDIPLPEGPINELKLAFSSVVDNGEFLGRVIWFREMADDARGVWKYDFTVNNGTVHGVGEEEMFLKTESYRNQGISYLDLSPDRQFLVYGLWENGDPYPDNIISIRTIIIADCLGTSSPCAFDDGTEVYTNVDTPDTSVAFRSPVWGPLGERIYFIESENDAVDIMWVNATNPSPAPESLITIGKDIGFVREVSSGIGYGLDGDTEYLAVTIGIYDWKGMVIHGCREIFTLDVDGCPNCDLQHETAGTHPSWNRVGKLIHTSQGLELKNPTNCAVNTIGTWDGRNLETLGKGYEPEAAGG